MADANIKDWDIVSADNDGVLPEGAPENMPRSNVNNLLREIMGAMRRDWASDSTATGGGAWRDPNDGNLPTYTSAASIQIPGIDVTDSFPPNRKIRIEYLTGADGYCFVATSVYSMGNTNLTVEDFDDLTPDHVVRNVTMTRVSFYSAFGGSSLHELGRGAFESAGGGTFVIPLAETDVGIQDAIALAITEGKIILLKDATYTISSTLTIPSETVIWGVGWGRSIIKAANSFNNPIITIDDSATDIEFKGFEIDGNASTLGSLGNGIEFGETNKRVFIENIYFHDMYTTAIAVVPSVTSAQEVFISKCKIDTCGGHGIQITDPSSTMSGVFLSNLNISNCATGGVGDVTGTCIETGGAVTVSNVYLDHSNNSSSTYGAFTTTATVTKDVLLSNFIIIASTGTVSYGLLLQGDGATISNGHIAMATSGSMSISGDKNQLSSVVLSAGLDSSLIDGDDNFIRNCQIIDGSITNIIMDGNRNIVTGCLFRDCTKGIVIPVTGDDNYITYNMFDNCTTAIEISASASNDNVVFPNQFRACTTNVSDSGTNTRTRLDVFVKKISADQTGIATARTAVGDLTGVDYPLVPDGSRRFLVELNLAGQTDVSSSTALTFRMHSGSTGDETDPILFTLGPSYTGDTFYNFFMITGRFEEYVTPGVGHTLTASIQFSAGTANVIYKDHTLLNGTGGYPIVYALRHATNPAQVSVKIRYIDG